MDSIINIISVGNSITNALYVPIRKQIYIYCKMQTMKTLLHIDENSIKKMLITPSHIEGFTEASGAKQRCKKTSTDEHTPVNESILRTTLFSQNESSSSNNSNNNVEFPVIKLHSEKNRNSLSSLVTKTHPPCLTANLSSESFAKPLENRRFSGQAEQNLDSFPYATKGCSVEDPKGPLTRISKADSEKKELVVGHIEGLKCHPNKPTNVKTTSAQERRRISLERRSSILEPKISPNNTFRSTISVKPDKFDSFCSACGSSLKDKPLNSTKKTIVPRDLYLDERNKITLESLQDAIFELQDQSVIIFEEIKKVSFIINGLIIKIMHLQSFMEQL